MLRFLLLALFVLASPAVVQAGSSGGTTALSFSPGHGTQVEFLDRGGKSYLWYPGNSIVLPGQWRTQGPIGAQQMCFKYGPNSYNPVTHVYGDVWECETLRQYASVVDEQQTGDVFGLSHLRAVPFVLGPGRTTIEQLARRLGGAAHLGTIVPFTKPRP